MVLQASRFSGGQTEYNNLQRPVCEHSTMHEPFITPPDARYCESFCAAVAEFQDEGRWLSYDTDALREQFEQFCVLLRARRSRPPAGMVPESIFWLIAEEQFAGRLSLRHRLNRELERYGGHIGYEIRPSLRRRGYGRLICRLGLEEARKLGLARVLLTCDDDNVGSFRIIESNGGLLQDRIDNGRHALTRRYWVTLD